MAKTKPFFLTGANAKIKLNGRTVAFATDISYRIIVRHASPRVLGRFEVEAHQPLSYDVEGAFTIIRYAKGLKAALGKNAPTHPIPEGNGIGSFGAIGGGVTGQVGQALGLPTVTGQFDGRTDEAFIPSRMFQSKAFDIEIIQKTSSESSDAGGLVDLSNLLIEQATGVSGLIGSPGVDGECTIARLEGCRIQQADFSLSKKSAAIQTFTFKAQYAHEDTFTARKSGVGQELS